jgi:hypothetical protein
MRMIRVLLVRRLSFRRGRDKIKAAWVYYSMASMANLASLRSIMCFFWVFEIHGTGFVAFNTQSVAGHGPVMLLAAIPSQTSFAARDVQQPQTQSQSFPSCISKHVGTKDIMADPVYLQLHL